MSNFNDKIYKAVLIDVDYVVRNDVPYIRLLLMGKRGFFRRYVKYLPYFFAELPDEARTAVENLSVETKKGIAKVVRTETIKMLVGSQEKRLLKIYVDKPYNVPVLSLELKGIKVYENRIPFARRYMIDKQISPFAELHYRKISQKEIYIIDICEPKFFPKFRDMAFDIETYNPNGSPRINEDPVLMISVVEKERDTVFVWKKFDSDQCEADVIFAEDEYSMIKKFLEFILKRDYQLIYGYNSTLFDFPYLRERARKNGLDFLIGKDDKELRLVSRGISKAIKISGRIHIDMYQLMRFFSVLGIVKLSRYTLEEVSQNIFGRGKENIDRLSIWKLWDEGKVSELVSYCVNDARLTYLLANKFLDLIFELAYTSKLTLYEIITATSGQLVESLLMHHSYQRKQIIPNKPDDHTVNVRLSNPIEGAYVKIPMPGIYDHIVVFDFRSLYPSIICSFNIDPFTYNCDCCAPQDAYVSPQGHRFCRKKRGLIPEVLEKLIAERFKFKDLMKKLPKESDEYKRVSARVQALKIIANSFYGYLGYARSRWYSREAAESVTAWGREYIKSVIAKAEEMGFTVLYSDTDSIFIKLASKEELSRALTFLSEVNASLPGTMELEFENYFPRALFVSKKSEGIGAKKKYALIDEEGNIKVRGFEVVRRDWSTIAKNTQKKVIETILREGSKEKAISIVREVVDNLNSGNVDIKDLVIYTQLKKDVSDYAVISPELSAAKKAIARGIMLRKGDIFGYVITRSGRNISEKAEYADFASDYDPSYYINNQVLPAVMRIFAELGVTEQELKLKGKQTSMGDFF